MPTHDLDHYARLAATERQRDAYRALLVVRRTYGSYRWFAAIRPPGFRLGFEGGNWSQSEQGYYFETKAEALAALDVAAGLQPTTET